MKKFIYYDIRHNYVYIIEAAHKKESKKKLKDQLILSKCFDSETLKYVELHFSEYFLEPDKIITI